MEGYEGPSNRLEHKFRDLWLIAGHPLENVLGWITEEEGIAENDPALQEALKWAQKFRARAEGRAAAGTATE